MVRMQISFPNSHAKCEPHWPPGARTGRLFMGVLLMFLLGFAGASAALAQEQEGQERQVRQDRASGQERQTRPEGQERQARPVVPERQERVTDWATDNLDMVSASPAQIRDVLTKDLGLMVELKRLMAKQAIEKGQIVGERDLEDNAILDRLATDTRFRALATRLLQRYGYLSPQLNPESPSVLSNYKSNRLNWMHESYAGNGALKLKKACKIGVFWKIVMLRICRILYKLRSSCSCFFKIATST